MSVPFFTSPPVPGACPRLRYAAHAGDEELISRLLQARSFGELTVPLVDRAAPYEGIVPGELLRRTYRFADRDGEILLLRSDFTPVVARTLAPILDGASLPLRAFYRGEIVRVEESASARGGTRRQIGAEIVGGDVESVDSEILRIVAEICSSTGLRCTVALSDASLLDAIVDGADDEKTKIALRIAIASKRRETLSELGTRLPEELAQVAGKFIRGTLSIDDLLGCDNTRAAGARLARLERMMEELDGVQFARPVLAIDSAERDRSYYTGFRFAAFTPGATEPIASGGRYDQLYERFGSAAPAAGFTFDLDFVERLR